jgi:hypothetical protein
MIFIHLLLGIILGKLYGHYALFILGSLFPDLDHLYIIIKNRLFTIKKIAQTIKYESEYELKYKTPLFHSLLGLILFSAIICIFYGAGALYFAIAYLIHLLIDWIDIDEKYYLYPLNIKFRGFLPIWSRTEKIITIILLMVAIILFL